MVEHSASGGMNLSYSTPVAVAATVGEVRFFWFLLFSAFNMHIGLLLACKASLFRHAKRVFSSSFYYSHEDMSFQRGG